MKKHETRQERPRRAPYCQITIDDVPWTFRIPRWAKIAPMVGEGSPADADGRIIALCWADEEWALESAPTDGEAVFEELYEAGWSQVALFALVRALIRQAVDDCPKEAEVTEKVAFFLRGSGLSESESFGSGKSTTEASTPSTA